MKIKNTVVTPLADLDSAADLPFKDEFFYKVYALLYARLDPISARYPHIDFDTCKSIISSYVSAMPADQQGQLRSFGDGAISKAEWEKATAAKAMQVFLWNFPVFGHLLTNIHLLGGVAIKVVEHYMGEEINAVNFIAAKRMIDEINRQRWTREQDSSERQSGVSILGNISENLLEKAMMKLINEQSFFKSTNQKVQSYGDFVLTCLPNNLWLSVKSNFARERLLASGFTTDIIGVGFFTDKKEFVSLSKIRNYQRVGFLAMYLPDVPLTDGQVSAETSTYHEVVEYYKNEGRLMPMNINGSLFLRPLSTLHGDIAKLLQFDDVRDRTTLDF